MLETKLVGIFSGEKISNRKEINDSLENFLVNFSDRNSKSLRELMILDYYLDFGVDNKKNIKQSIKNKEYSRLPNIKNLTYNKKQNDNTEENMYDTKTYFIALSYLDIIKNDSSSDLIKKAENVNDLKAIVLVDELIKDLKREKISYVVYNSKPIKENLAQLLNSYKVVEARREISHLKNGLDELTNFTNYDLKISFDDDYTTQLSIIKNKYTELKSRFDHFGKQKELRRFVKPYKENLELIEKRLCSNIKEINEVFESNAEKIKTKVDRLINSRIAVNRESRLDGYEKMAGDYMKIEAKLKCLN